MPRESRRSTSTLPGACSSARAPHERAHRRPRGRHRRPRPVGDDAVSRRGRRRVRALCRARRARRAVESNRARGPDADALHRGRRDRRGELRRLRKGVLDTHGRIDVLVNGVGGFAGGDLLSTSLAEWERMIALNLTSAVIGCRAVLPAMTAAGAGRIVNIASRAVVPPLGGFIAYTVAKAGVITLTQA